jgi:hypothetical protein
MFEDPDFFNNPPQQEARESVGQRLVNIFQGIHHQRNGLLFENLKRVSYENEKEKLDYEDCPICIESFYSSSSERLIYLPCNRKHIFHQSCIIEWLRRELECPLCRAPINNAAIEGYQN